MQWKDNIGAIVAGLVVALFVFMLNNLGNQIERNNAQILAIGGELRAEIGELRSELRTEIGELRSELRTEIGEVRKELSKTNDRIDRTNDRIDRTNDRIDRVLEILQTRLAE